MSDGSEFQVCGAATENSRRANSVRVLAADSSGASENRSALTDDSGQVVLSPLQDVEGGGGRTVQHGVAVVTPGCTTRQVAAELSATSSKRCLMASDLECLMASLAASRAA